MDRLKNFEEIDKICETKYDCIAKYVGHTCKLKWLLQNFESTSHVISLGKEYTVMIKGK